MRGLVRQLSIDQLDNEGRRVGVYEGGAPIDGSPLFTPPPLPVGDKGTHKVQLRGWCGFCKEGICVCRACYARQC